MTLDRLRGRQGCGQGPWAGQVNYGEAWGHSGRPISWFWSVCGQVVWVGACSRCGHSVFVRYWGVKVWVWTCGVGGCAAGVYVLSRFVQVLWGNACMYWCRCVLVLLEDKK